MTLIEHWCHGGRALGTYISSVVNWLETTTPMVLHVTIGLQTSHIWRLSRSTIWVFVHFPWVAVWDCISLICAATHTCTHWIFESKNSYRKCNAQIIQNWTCLTCQTAMHFRSWPAHTTTIYVSWLWMAVGQWRMSHARITKTLYHWACLTAACWRDWLSQKTQLSSF